MFDLDSFEPSENNYIDNYDKCLNIYNELMSTEQEKPYGCANTILMWKGDKIIK